MQHLLWSSWYELDDCDNELDNHDMANWQQLLLYSLTSHQIFVI